MRDYYPFSDEAYQREAAAVQKSVDAAKAQGATVSSELAWAWIKQRTPGWQELDWEKVWRQIKL